MKKFDKVSEEIQQLISQWESKLLNLEDSIIIQRHNSQNRTIKQIVGHMIDSATNNTHRVIHLQYQESPCRYPDYANLGNNDRWIAIQNFQDEDWHLLVAAWKFNNLHYAYIIKQIDENQIDNEWISALNDVISLNDMVIDYPRHLKLHLKEIEALINQ